MMLWRYILSDCLLSEDHEHHLRELLHLRLRDRAGPLRGLLGVDISREQSLGGDGLGLGLPSQQAKERISWMPLGLHPEVIFS